MSADGHPCLPSKANDLPFCRPLVINSEGLLCINGLFTQIFWGCTVRCSIDAGQLASDHNSLSRLCSLQRAGNSLPQLFCFPSGCWPVTNLHTARNVCSGLSRRMLSTSQRVTLSPQQHTKKHSFVWEASANGLICSPSP